MLNSMKSSAPEKDKKECGGKCGRNHGEDGAAA
jgi:hypothetical protein